MARELRLEIASSIADLRRIEAPLRSLARSCNAAAFSHPGFLLPWAEAAVATGQSVACHYLYRGGDLVGFVPLFFRRDRKALMARRGGPPRFGSSPPFELLIAPGEDREAAAQHLAKAVAAERWLDLTFPNEPDDSLLLGCWARAFEQHGFSVRQSAGPAYQIIQGLADSAAYEDQMRGRSRREFRRRERRMQEEGSVSVFTSDDDPDMFLADMERILQASWKFDERMAKIGVRLYRDQVRGTAADGTLRFWICHYRQRPASFLFELADATGSRHAYFTAHDPNACGFGAGGALVFLAAKASLDAGVPVYDFWGTQPYLRHLSNGLRRTRTVTVARKDPLSRLRLSTLEMLQATRSAAKTLSSGRHP